jgi:hypothetical protein
MRRCLAATAALGFFFVLGACDGTDGTRGPCAAGGQILDDPTCHDVETVDDACWKLVECGVIPLESEEGGPPDWSNCVGWLEDMREHNRTLAIACVDAASCDQLLVNDSPNNPYERPDCLELR